MSGQAPEWVKLGVLVAGWLVTSQVLWRKMAADGDAGLEDRLAAGFLGLFWPLILGFAVLAGIFLLPTLRWRTIQRGGAAVGWAVARWRLGSGDDP